MTKTKTKTIPGGTQQWVTSYTKYSSRPGYPSSTETHTQVKNIVYPANTITYAVGPKYLTDPHRHCNWKYCTHSGFSSKYSVTSYSCSAVKEFRSGQRDEEWCYNVNIPAWCASYWPSMPADPAPDIPALAAEMYADLHGRVDTAFLSLEDLAGLLSGKSFVSSIRGVAGSANSVAKAVRDLKKLRKAFGRKASLYNMWLSSKELVRQIIGFHLGERFAFKATLTDIVEAVGIAQTFADDVKRLSLRNDGQFHRYSKTQSLSNRASSALSGSSWRQVLLNSIPYNGSTVSNLSASRCGTATLTSENRVRSTLYTWAKVWYPKEYVTTQRVLIDRFGLNKPLSTLWAIVPCSFVLDYLLRIQDYLEHVDNTLNEYQVDVSLSDAWLLTSKTRTHRLQWPGFEGSFQYSATMKYTGTFPPLDVVESVDRSFTRTPFSTGQIMSAVGPLFRTDDKQWTSRVGTGLELLLSRWLG